MIVPLISSSSFEREDGHCLAVSIFVRSLELRTHSLFRVPGTGRTAAAGRKRDQTYQ